MSKLNKELIRWRVARKLKDTENGPIGQLVAYIDGRTAMAELDEADSNWTTEPPQPIIADGKIIGMVVGVTVNGITRWDVGAATSMEPVKGAMSDGLKRASVQHGIARELYEMPQVYALCRQEGRSIVPIKKPNFNQDTGRWEVDAPGWVWYPDEEPDPVAEQQVSPRNEARNVAKRYNFTAADVERIAAEEGLSMADKDNFTDDQWRQLTMALVVRGAQNAIDSK